MDGVDLSTVRLDSLPHAAGSGAAGIVFVRRDDSRERGVLAADASEEEIMRACRIARVDEFAESFADKYDTIVGERGVKLSGGQRQRISIARAILAEPRILILDEATSSLDSESEQMIQQGLSYLMQGRTTFVIAHRLVHHSPGRPDHGDGAGTNRRARHARRNFMPRADATTICTRGSMEWKKTCSWLRAREMRWWSSGNGNEAKSWRS